MTSFYDGIEELQQVKIMEANKLLQGGFKLIKVDTILDIDDVTGLNRSDFYYVLARYK
jgi:hypothetical protein